MYLLFVLFFVFAQTLAVGFQNEKILNNTIFELRSVLDRLSDVHNTLAVVTGLIPKDCADALSHDSNPVTGIQLIYPEVAPKPYLAVCDMQTEGGGWIQVFNRMDGGQNFNLGWHDYKIGFGNMISDFWLGLEKLHHLTYINVQELLVMMVHSDGTISEARYGAFSVANEEHGYALDILGAYEGTAGDGLMSQGGAKFSTKDRDNDDSVSNCAVDFGGGWWFKKCTDAHLTGKFGPATPRKSGMWWMDTGLKQARMFIRPRNAASRAPVVSSFG